MLPTGCVFVFLHGNKIAEIGDDSLTLFDGGWQSNTTKSRLNARVTIPTFGYTCGQVREYVFQKNSPSGLYNNWSLEG